SGDDLLIAGTSDFDHSVAALNAIMAEWSRTDASYAVRIAHLRDGQSGGLNGPYLLNAATVHNNGAADRLGGGPGLDWFFAGTEGANRDQIKDLQSLEVMTAIALLPPGKR